MILVETDMFQSLKAVLTIDLRMQLYTAISPNISERG